MFRTSFLTILALSVLLLLAGCSSQKLTPEESWARQTLESLTLREKVAQMMVYHMRLDYLPEGSEKWQEIETILEDEGIGVLHVWGGPLGTAVETLNEMQRRSKVPIMVQADLEYGLNARFPGGTHIPWPMAQTATWDPELAYEAGRITAIEGRAVGIHLALAPVADVNNNPFNPIINTRAYSEDPDQVITYASAFLKGMQEHGMAGTAKHFPGHGDTETDSHSKLAVIPSDSARLWDIELKPFKALVDAGVEVAMVGHLDAGDFQYEPGVPSSLSPYWLNGILRDEMGFKGVIITDNMGMGGITNHYTDRSALIKTINAGSDLIIQNYDYRNSVNMVIEAVTDGMISESRIDEAAYRILTLKAKLGLHKRRTVDFNLTRHNYGHGANLEKGAEIVEKSITLVRDRDSLLLNDAIRHERVYCIDLYDRAHSDSPTRVERILRGANVKLTNYILDIDEPQQRYDEVSAAIPDSAIILINAFCSIHMNKDRIFFPQHQQEFVNGLSARSERVILVSFGTPYLLYAFPDIQTYLCAYGGRSEVQEAAAKAILGLSAVSGRLPVTIPGIAPHGAGIQVKPHAVDTQTATDSPFEDLPSEITDPLPLVDPEEMDYDVAKVMTVMRRALDENAWPGGVLVAGKDGRIFLNEYFGTHTYDDEMGTYRADVFDLASVSKVIGTTSAAMKLYEEGRLDLDTAVVAYLPEFQGPDSLQTEWKKRVTPRHLLTHTSGLLPFQRFYTMEAPDITARFDSVFQSPLDTLPGIEYVYSDIGMITLGKVIERITGMGLDEYTRTAIFEPLGMESTGYTPTLIPRDRIVPTEISDWAGELIHGYVHDENSHSLGGVTGHAGLFSTGLDLARYAQMILNDGILGDVRIFQPETIELFLQPAGIVEEGYGATRTLGWGGPWEDSSGGIYVDSNAVGHTGYTGTSVWIDPGNQIFVILLTNAVHPHRSWKYPNYFDWRHLVHSAVYESVGFTEPNPGLEWSERWIRERELEGKGKLAHWQYKYWLKRHKKGR